MILTVKEIAKRCGVTQATVIHWVKSGQLRAKNYGRDLGKLKPRYKITQTAFAEFDQSRDLKPPAPRRARVKVASGSRRQFYAES